MDEGELPAGLPSEKSNKTIIGIAIGVLSIPFIAIVVLAFRSCFSTNLAEKIAEFDVKQDEAAENPLALAAGTHLVFGVSSSYEYSGRVSIMLEVSLLKDAAIVASKECNMKQVGNGGFGSGGSTWYGDAGWTCTLDVPNGGTTAIRATVKKGGSGSLELSHTSVIVKRP